MPVLYIYVCLSEYVFLFGLLWSVHVPRPDYTSAVGWERNMSLELEKVKARDQEADYWLQIAGVLSDCKLTHTQTNTSCQLSVRWLETWAQGRGWPHLLSNVCMCVGVGVGVCFHRWMTCKWLSSSSLLIARQKRKVGSLIRGGLDFASLSEVSPSEILNGANSCLHAVFLTKTYFPCLIMSF